MEPETELEFSLNVRVDIEISTFLTAAHAILVVKVYLSFWSGNSPETVEESSLPNPIPTIEMPSQSTSVPVLLV